MFLISGHDGHLGPRPWGSLLVALTKSMRDATSGATGWYRLGQLLLTVNA